MDEAVRQLEVRRNTRLLITAQAALSATAPVIFVVGSVAVEQFSGSRTIVGVYTALFFAAAAVTALLAGRAMDRRGRRPVLAVGEALVLVSGIAAMIAAAAGSWTGLLIAALPYGAGYGIAQLARGSVADMYPPDRRGRAVGLMLAASVVGAVGAPFLTAFVQQVGEDRFGFDPLVVGWVTVPIFAALALACVLAMRVDPKDLAVALDPKEAEAPTRPPSALLRVAPFRAAVVAAGVGQAVMVGVMGVTPIVLHDHGGSELVVSSVLSGHFLGMYALMPAIGWLLDRVGRKRGLLLGLACSAAGALLASATDASALIGLGLFFVGLGWAGAFLGATAVIGDVTVPAERGGALGFNDLIVSTMSAVGAFAGGALLQVAGFGAMTAIAAALFIPVLILVLPLREGRPGHFQGADPTSRALGTIEA